MYLAEADDVSNLAADEHMAGKTSERISERSDKAETRKLVSTYDLRHEESLFFFIITSEGEGIWY